MAQGSEQRTGWLQGRALIRSSLVRMAEDGQLADTEVEVTTGLVLASLQVRLAAWAGGRRSQDAAVVADQLVDQLGAVLDAATPRSGVLRQ